MFKYALTQIKIVGLIWNKINKDKNMGLFNPTMKDD